MSRTPLPHAARSLDSHTDRHVARWAIAAACIFLAPGCYAGNDRQESDPWNGVNSGAQGGNNGDSAGPDETGDGGGSESGGSDGAGDPGPGPGSGDGDEEEDSDGSDDGGGNPDDSGADPEDGETDSAGGSNDDDSDDSNDNDSSDDDSNDGNGSSGGGPSDDEIPDNAYCQPVSNFDAGWSQLEWDVLELVNEVRAQGANCGSEGSFGPAGPLTMQPALRCAARKHSKDMADRSFFDHTNPSGESPWDRMGRAGYNYSRAGENIAGGSATAAGTMDQWMNSDGHCANIMNPEFEELGVGYYPGGQWGHLWTQVFGSQ